MALRFGVVVGGENCRSLGYARDDKGGGWRFDSLWLSVERTADPSAALGMTKGRMALRFSVVVGGENCRSLHGRPGQAGCARDDKGGGWRFGSVRLLVEIQIFAEHAGRSLRTCSQRQLCPETHGGTSGGGEEC